MTAPQRRVMRLRRRVEELLPAKASPGSPPARGEAAAPPPGGPPAAGQGVKLPGGQAPAPAKGTEPPAGGTLPQPRGAAPPMGLAPDTPPWAKAPGGSLTAPWDEGQDSTPQLGRMGRMEEASPMAADPPGEASGEYFLEQLRRQRRRSPRIQDFWEELT